MVFKTTDTKISSQTTNNGPILTDNQKILLSGIIFFVAIVFFFQFMNLFKNGVEQNFGIFWFLVFCLYGSVAYQIYNLKTQNERAKLFIIFEIIFLVLFWGLFRIMLTNQLLPGADDAYGTLTSTNYIQNHSDFLTKGSTLDRWPTIQLLSIIISEICNIELFDIALFSPIFYKILAIVFLYLFAKELYDDRIALSACLVFSPFYMVWSINSRFRPEILAYIFFLTYVWAFVRRGKDTSKPVLWSSLSIFFAFSIVITHYTTNVMFIFLCGVTLLVFLCYEFLNLKQPVKKFFKYAPTFTLFAIVIWQGYWIYIGEPMFVRFCQSMTEATAPVTQTQLEYATLSPATTSLKQVIMGRIEAFYVFLFMGLMAYEIFKQRKCKTWQIDFWLASWAAFTFFFWVFLCGIPHLFFTGKGYLFPPSRIYLFVYPFILIVIVHIVFKLKSKKRTLFYILLIGFAFFNIFQIPFVPLNPFSSVAYPVSAGDGTQDWAAVNWAAPKQGKILAPIYFTPSVIYVVEKEASVYGYINYFENDMAGLKSCNWLYLNPSRPVFRIRGSDADIPLSEEMLYNISNTSWLEKIYTNGEWEIYRIK